MGRKKGPNTVQLHVNVPVELSDWLRFRATEMSIDLSSVVKILLLTAKKQQDEEERKERIE